MLLLHPPRQIAEEFQDRLDPVLAKERVSTVLKQSARGLIRELKELENQGEIAGFTLDPETYAVRVQRNPEIAEQQIVEKLQDDSIAMIVPGGPGRRRCS